MRALAALLLSAAGAAAGSGLCTATRQSSLPCKTGDDLARGDHIQALLYGDACYHLQADATAPIDVFFAMTHAWDASTDAGRVAANVTSWEADLDVLEHVEFLLYARLSAGSEAAHVVLRADTDCGQWSAATIVLFVLGLVVGGCCLVGVIGSAVESVIKGRCVWYDDPVTGLPHRDALESAGLLVEDEEGPGTQLEMAPLETLDGEVDLDGEDPDVDLSFSSGVGDAGDEFPVGDDEAAGEEEDAAMLA